MHKVGLVVAHLYDNMQLANYVLQLEDMEQQDRNPSKVYSVHKKAFTLPNEHKNQEVSIRKNLQRRAEKELFFGDIIEWSDDKPYGRNNLIYQFTRSKKLFECRCENGKSQIKLEGCIDPNKRNRFWSSNFPSIHIRGNNTLALPNVYLEAWVSIEILDDKVVQFDLVNIHGICPTEEQGNVGKAPWNIKNLKYNTITLIEFDDEDDCFEDCPPNNNAPRQEVYDLLVFAVNDRSFYCDTYPQYRFSLVVFEDLVVSGSYYRIDAIWNRFDEYYMVKKAIMKKDLKNFPIDESGRIRTSVKQICEFPGVYYSESLGFIDDPYNVFALLNISPYISKTFMVALEDGIPNKSFRFRIVDVIDSKERLKKFVSSNNDRIELKNLIGLAISNKLVFCSKYPQTTFKVSPGLVPPKLGTYLKYDAVFDSLKNFFEIITWKADESSPPVIYKVIEERENNDKAVFKTKVKKIKKKELNGFFESEMFGLLDDRGRASSMDDEGSVWVAYAESTLERGMRQSRTTFEIICVGDLNYSEYNAAQRHSDQSLINNYHPQCDEMAHSDLRNDLVSTIPDSITAAYYSPTMSIGDNSQSTHDQQDNASLLNGQLLQHRRERLGSSIYSHHSNYSDSTASLNFSMTGSMNFDRETCFEKYQLLQHRYAHSANCTDQICREDCPYMNAVISEVLTDDSFYRQLRYFFPVVAEEIKQKSGNFSPRTALEIMLIEHGVE
ncbi:unnamed protein product [Auanema sp. JU1783]|nr:unnamed protein product [Auanema sp. JU1783]